MTLVQLAITALNTILASYKLQNAPAEVIASIEAAIAALFKAHGAEMTFENIEALRVSIPDWTKQP